MIGPDIEQSVTEYLGKITTRKILLLQILESNGINSRGFNHDLGTVASGFQRFLYHNRMGVFNENYPRYVNKWGQKIFEQGANPKELGFTPSGFHGAVTSTLWDSVYESNVWLGGIERKGAKIGDLSLFEKDRMQEASAGHNAIIELIERGLREEYLFQAQFDLAPWYNPQVQ